MDMQWLREQEADVFAALIDEGVLMTYYSGEPIWWNDAPRGGYGAFRPVIAVFISRRGSRAGIAVACRDGSWRPKIVSFSKICSRLD